jgi:Domain of unknown function (DUF4410)
MKLTLSTFVFSLALANVVAYSQATAADATAAQSKPKQALILPFAVANNAAATPGASGDACPKTPGNNLADTDSQKLIDTISAELQKKLAKKMEARVSQPGDEPVNGTLVLAGCLTTIDPGNAAERMAGMNLGASQLAAHVVVQLKTEDALVAVREFDATAKGSKALPPLGMVGVATHAAAERRETLNADAKRLADEILKTLSKKATN